jgi:hypothetical protein
VRLPLFVDYRTPRAQYCCRGTFARLLRFRVELTSAHGVTGIRAMHRMSAGVVAMIVSGADLRKTSRPSSVSATLRLITLL